MNLFSRRSLLFYTIGLWALVLAVHTALAEQQTDTTPLESDVLDMSLEDLLDTQVTSVSKRSQSLSDAPAAIFVITREDLRRTGVTNIPDALRMAPGIHVARIDANKWAVTARGFNGRFANKLLVLIDGRIIYSASFSGVYWEMQDVMLEDVERIEVIRGPGATLWGANAVNGVINIITRHAADTQGGLVTLGSGTEERGFASVRYGTRLAQGTYGRIYAKTFQQDEFANPNGGGAGDDWRVGRGGFRVDSQATGQDSLTLQGEIHRGDIQQTLKITTPTSPYSSTLVQDDTKVFGGHMVMRWDHSVSNTSGWTFQAYYDYFDRDEFFLREQRKTLDLDLTYRTNFDNSHNLVWGLDYRYSKDQFHSSPIIQVTPERRKDQLFSAFIQDEIELIPRKLWLTLGSKFEHNDYTGFEVQPGMHLAWTKNPSNKFWASISRAVRTPSRSEHDFIFQGDVRPPLSPGNPLPLPIQVLLIGNEDQESETLIAYELGYRTAPLENINLDFTVFYNDYDDLRFFSYDPPILADPPTYAIVPLRLNNGAQGSTYGMELAAFWQATDKLRFDLAYSFIETDIDWVNAIDIVQNTAAPRHLLSLRSSLNILDNLDLDLWLRYNDKIKVLDPSLSNHLITLDDYLTLDFRLGWRPLKNVEFSLVGQNLLDGRHLEYIQERFILPTEVEPSIYGKFELKF